MTKLFYLVLALMIAVSLLPPGRSAEAGQPDDQASGPVLAQAEECLRKVAWLNLFVSGQLKARWFNILRFCYDGVEITDWQLLWRPRIFSSEWRYIRLIGPKITGSPFRMMLFQTEAVFRGQEGTEIHTWRPWLWQRAFPSGRWSFGGQQQYW